VIELDSLKEKFAATESVSVTCNVGLARLQSVTKEMFIKVEKTFGTHNEKIEEVFDSIRLTDLFIVLCFVSLCS
jgi:hypothetical protein